MCILCHKIIEYVECKEFDTLSDMIKNLNETFPKCYFYIHIDSNTRRLSVTHDFYRYWFNIMQDNTLTYLTYEYLR